MNVFFSFGNLGADSKLSCTRPGHVLDMSLDMAQMSCFRSQTHFFHGHRTFATSSCVCPLCPTHHSSLTYPPNAPISYNCYWGNQPTKPRTADWLEIWSLCKIKYTSDHSNNQIMCIIVHIKSNDINTWHHVLKLLSNVLSWRHPK